VGAIQHQFGDKAGVLAAVVGRGFDALITQVVQLPADPGELPVRVGRLVETIWRHYALPQSRAAIEIAIQMRSDREFLSVSVPYLARIRGAIDRMWMGFFWDVHAARSQHVRAQRLLFTTLNGLIVEDMLMPISTDVTGDLEILADGIVRILTSEA
jgi:AcrR family transcriptional regulator